MNFHQTAIAVPRAVLIAGLAMAYASAAAGLAGFFDARTVSKLILIGAIVAFVAMLLYLAASELQLRRRLRRELTVR